MTRLNQIIALEQGARKNAKTALDSAAQMLASPAINGQTRVYAPRADDGEQYPDENKLVQVIGEEVMDRLAEVLARMFSLVLTKDTANQDAVADLVVDGDTLLGGVPTSYLLFLEAQLAELAVFVRKMPVLDPKERWGLTDRRGLYAGMPSKRARNDRVPEPVVLYPATPEHPAQVKTYEREVPVGDWTQTQLSGAFTFDRVQALADRIQRLVDACRSAREEANSAGVETMVADPVARYLFDGLHS